MVDILTDGRLDVQRPSAKNSRSAVWIFLGIAYEAPKALSSG